MFLPQCERPSLAVNIMFLTPYVKLVLEMISFGSQTCSKSNKHVVIERPTFFGHPSRRKWLTTAVI
jgi:hypothetical protein